MLGAHNRLHDILAPLEIMRRGVGAYDEMKPSSKQINAKIATAAKLLDEVASMVRDADLKPRKNIRRIGIALTYIFEVQHDTWRADPSLVPKWLKGNPDKETGGTWGVPARQSRVRLRRP